MDKLTDSQIKNGFKVFKNENAPEQNTNYAPLSFLIVVPTKTATSAYENKKDIYKSCLVAR